MLLWICGPMKYGFPNGYWDLQTTMKKTTFFSGSCHRLGRYVWGNFNLTPSSLKSQLQSGRRRFAEDEKRRSKEISSQKSQEWLGNLSNKRSSSLISSSALKNPIWTTYKMKRSSSQELQSPSTSWEYISICLNEGNIYTHHIDRSTIDAL